MAYRFKRDIASVQDGVREIAGELIDDAIACAEASEGMSTRSCTPRESPAKSCAVSYVWSAQYLPITGGRMRLFAMQAAACPRCGIAAF